MLICNDAYEYIQSDAGSKVRMLETRPLMCALSEPSENNVEVVLCLV